MHGPHVFLTNLALVLCVAAVTTVLFQRLKQPVVLGYVMAGLLVGPHFPMPLFADQGIIETLSELGVILVMFSLGLEFSIRKLLRRGIGIAAVAAIEVSAMLWLGFVTAKLFGWSPAEAMLTAAAVSISSTTIIAKTFEEQKIDERIKEVVFGVLIFEDLIAILLLATLPAVVSGQARSVNDTMGTLASTTGKLLGFLVVLLVVGMMVVPRLMRFILRLGRSETTLVASVGLCFAMALLVQKFGYSVALGAFLAGSLVSESGAGHRVERLVKPIRDMFAAIFFVSVGMLIDPKLVTANWGAVLVLTAVVLAGKLLSVSVASFLSGHSVRTSVQAGMSMAQIGEFSFILVGLGLTLGVVRPFLFPVVVSVSVATTLLTPLLVKASGRASARFYERLPPALQTFCALYGTWFERLSSPARGPQTPARRMRRRLALMLGDVVALAAVIIGASLSLKSLVQRVSPFLHGNVWLAHIVVVAVAVVIGSPFCLGAIRLARTIGGELAELALPRAGKGQLDLAAAPRRAFVVSLQLAVALVFGAPLVAVTQPFLPSFEGAAVFLLVVAVLGITFWRSATNLQGHVRAGAQVIVEVLAAQGTEPHHDPNQSGTHITMDNLSVVKQSLPGLGAPVPLPVKPRSPAIGKTLVELNLRGLTGATVLAITRAGGAIVVPTGHERLSEGDVLAITGTTESIEAAQRLIEAVS
ncbi:MAG: cation:proton antiporter [Deltaproteobacteria bacterium]|nr:cation:proton antiporter [Deltaproteobacteria bacterium]